MLCGVINAWVSITDDSLLLIDVIVVELVPTEPVIEGASDLYSLEVFVHLLYVLYRVDHGVLALAREGEMDACLSFGPFDEAVVATDVMAHSTHLLVWQDYVLAVHTCDMVHYFAHSLSFKALNTIIVDHLILEIFVHDFWRQ